MYLHNPPLNSSAQAHLTSAYYTSSICRLSTSFPNTLLASINIILNTGDTLHIMAPSVLRLASSDCGEMLSMFTSMGSRKKIRRKDWFDVYGQTERLKGWTSEGDFKAQVTDYSSPGPVEENPSKNSGGRGTDLYRNGSPRSHQILIKEDRSRMDDTESAMKTP